MRELAVGQKVICKYKNGRYYHSDVVELTTATFYEVVFDDGSYSDNLFPEDIEVIKINKLLCQVKTLLLHCCVASNILMDDVSH